MKELSFLEKRIKEKAEEKFERDWNELVEALQENSIARLLFLKAEGMKKEIWLIGNYTKDSLFYSEPPRTDVSLKEFTNFKAVKENLLEKYEKEETDRLLSEINSKHWDKDEE